MISGKNTVRWLIVLVMALFCSVRADMTTEEMLATPAELRKGTATQHKVAQKVVGMLNKWHYASHSVTPSTCNDWFNNFFEQLDARKCLFTKQDIEQFRKYESNLWNNTLKRVDLEFPYLVFQKYLELTHQRALFIKSLAQTPMDFTAKESIFYDPKNCEYPANDDERKELWRKIFKNELLLLKLDEEKKASGEVDEDRDPDDEAPENKTLEEKIQDLVKSYARSYKRRTELEANEIFEIYMNSLTSLYDPHTAYMAPAARDDFNIQMSLSLQGIGATLSSKNGYVTVVEVVPGGPADKDGRLKKNDKILAVAQDGKEAEDVIEMPLNRVVRKIRGPKGTKVHLTIQSSGSRATKNITIVRDVVELKDQGANSVVQPVTCSNGQQINVLTMHLPSFYCDFQGRQKGNPDYRSTTRDMMALLHVDSVLKQKIDAVILDLRSNGGGSLEEAISLTGLFNPGVTPVVQIKDAAGQIDARSDQNVTCHFDGPLVVLTDFSSASASEIVAAALQDMGRAVIVGEKSTHGKGSVQNILEMDHAFSAFPLLSNDDPMGALKLTFAKFYRINGGSTQEKGVIPDIILPALSDSLETGERELPHCLHWDEIKPMTYTPSKALTPFLPILKENSKARLEKSEEYQQYLKEIAEYDKIRNIKTTPLDLDGRRELYKLQDQTEKMFTRYFRRNTNIQDKKKHKKQYTDLALKEAQAVAADLFQLTMMKKEEELRQQKEELRAANKETNN